VFVELSKNAKDCTELMMKRKDAAQEVPQESRRQESLRDSRREEASLDRCYGKIGISAVAAALPYQSDAKNPAYAPAVPREDTGLWFAELAAA
jgi:hypothetical protein